MRSQFERGARASRHDVVVAVASTRQTRSRGAVRLCVAERVWADGSQRRRVSGRSRRSVVTTRAWPPHPRRQRAESWGRTVADLRAGEPGRGPGSWAERLLGYYRNPEATGAAFAADGWLRSGDVRCTWSGAGIRIHRGSPPRSDQALRLHRLPGRDRGCVERPSGRGTVRSRRPASVPWTRRSRRSSS